MRQWLGKIILLALGALVALALCEVGLRLAGIEYPNFYEFDPVLGSRLRPGLKGYWLKEGKGYVSVNSGGWRDGEHELQKPENTVRIAVLGDSYAEALQVNQDEAFWAIMEKNLQGCGNLRGRRLEVLNFGRSGFGTAQELLALRHEVLKYSPDLVLLAFDTGNDVADNSPLLNHSDATPFYSLRDGQLALDAARVQRAGEAWSAMEKKRNWLGRFYTWRQDHLRTLQVISHSRNIIGEWLSSSSGDKPAAKGQGLVGGGMFIEIYREPRDQAWKEAWQLTERLLLEMRHELARHGIRFAVAVLSNDIQVHPDAAVRNKLARHPEVEDVFYPDRRVARFCESHGIPVLLLGPYFQQYAAEHQVFLHGFQTGLRNTLGSGHWNQYGHRLAGQRLAQWLCPQLN